MRPKLRFEIFKRDAFACCYCGKTPPQVLLEVDHLHPVCEGGTDDPDNLLTACFECNRGKGATTLDTAALPQAAADRAEQIAERLAQSKAYHLMLAEQEEYVQEQMNEVWEKWCDLFKGGIVDGYWSCDPYPPKAPTLRRFLKTLTLYDVLEAVEIAHNKFPTGRGSNPVRYFCGVCNNKIRRLTGEEAPA